jgi:glutathione S-transferase
MTITLHHLENSRSQRVLWLLEELGLPYEVQRYKRNPKTALAPPELRQVHPLGKSPVITEGGATLAESGAIIEYLLDTHAGDRLRPPAGTQQRRDFTYWLHFAEGSAMPPLLMKLVFDKISGPAVPFLVRPILKGVAAKVNGLLIQPNLQRHTDFMDATVAKAGWFAGSDFTAADIQMSFPVEATAARFGLQKHPALADWLARIHARPAYKRALDVGGPYSLVD